MQIAIDLFWTFGFASLIYCAVSSFRYPDTNRFFRALNFTPTNLCLRFFCVTIGLRGLADVSARYGKVGLRDVLTTLHLDKIASLAAVPFLLALAYGLFSKHVQGVKQAA